MKNIKIITGVKIKKEHIKKALELDYIAYESLYYLSFETCLSYFEKNNSIYIIALDEKDDVAGYVNFSPVTERMYGILKSGSVVDTAISADDIMEYKDGGRYFAYMSSVVVHPSLRRQGIAGAMLEELRDMIYTLAADRHIFFDGIIADAVTGAGAYILNSMGFSKLRNSQHGTEIMELNLSSPGLKLTAYNSNLRDIYMKEG